MVNGIIKLGWVKASIIERYKGFTPGSLSKKKERGQLIEGVHWKLFQGSVVYHYENIDEFIGNDGIAA